MDASTPMPETPAGRQARWLLDHFRDRGVRLTREEIDRHVRIPGASDDLLMEMLTELAEGLAESPLAAVDEEKATRLALIFTLANGRASRLTIDVERAEPFRIAQIWSGRQPADGLTVRRAGPEDDDALRDIEARTPRVAGEAESVERQDGIWDALALMQDAAVFIAEAGGGARGLIALARKRVIVGGEQQTLLYLHRMRVLPDSQRLGAGSALLDAALGYAADAGASSFFWYIAEDNEAAHAFAAASSAHAFAAASSGWATRPQLVILRCEDLAEPMEMAAASPQDASLLCEILNASHSDEQLYLPYDPATLGERVGRAPHIYRWDRLRLSEDAVIGVRADGARTRVWSERDGERRSATRAAVVDYGCRPGAEPQFERLLRAWCAELAGQGVEELAIHSSEHAHLNELLRGLAARVVPFELWTSGVGEPAAGAPQGLYTDPLYF